MIDHLTFCISDENGAWARIEKDFCGRLPLRNLIWKGGLTQAPQFIEQLNVKVIKDAGLGESGPPAQDTGEHTEGGSGAIEQPPPLLNLLVIDADCDSDAYKAAVRPRVKAWVARAAARRG
ncbi:hypothetical protein LPJ66_009576, partial [Kickxella alabastrina]